MIKDARQGVVVKNRLKLNAKTNNIVSFTAYVNKKSARQIRSTKTAMKMAA